MDSHLLGRKLTDSRDSNKPSLEVVHLIRKLRWLGMEEEAEQAGIQLRDATPTGGVITGVYETD
jgi:hypothetical protein